MPIPKELFPAAATIAASLIAGAIAFLTSVFAKETKISEFRQSWIDSIRNDIAEFVSAFYWITDTVKRREIEKSKVLATVSAELKDEFLKIELMQARIELRLNPVEHAALVRKLHGLVRFSSFDLKDSATRDKAIHDFVACSQEILRKEWKRVKRGEITFQVTKWASLAMFLAAVIAGALLASNHVVLSWQS